MSITRRVNIMCGYGHGRKRSVKKFPFAVRNKYTTSHKKSIPEGIKNEERDGFVFFVSSSSSSRATNISSRNNSEAKTNREEQ